MILFCFVHVYEHVYLCLLRGCIVLQYDAYFFEIILDEPEMKSISVNSM